MKTTATPPAAAPPSFWIQSSWRGDQNLREALGAHKRSDADRGGSHTSTAGSVGLYALYGSWNSVPKADHSGLLRLLDGLLRPHARGDVRYSTGRIQVDRCDEELEVCCGESPSRNETSGPELPCPPARLPVLLLVLRRSSMEEPEVRYLTAPSSNDILAFWKHRRRPTTATNATTITDAARNEARHALRSFGLAPASKQEAASPGSGSSLPRFGAIGSPASAEPPAPTVRIFVAGDRMSVGKTSVCLGLLGSLVRMGYPTESLAYIKPATQNEKPQLVQRYCERMGIPCVPIGPIVYYRGFTRAFLAGETESSEELLAKVEEAVDRLAEGKRVVIVDGVGFPAVGSICGTDNASVARASGYPIQSLEGNDRKKKGRKRRQPCGVVLVGGSGVGGAVDAFNLNATYFERADVPVLGGIFNKLSPDGFYSLENCKQQITSYFDQSEHQLRLGRKALGFVPLFPGIAGVPTDSIRMEEGGVFDYIRVFEEHVDMEGILEAASTVQDQSFPVEMDIDEGGEHVRGNVAAVLIPPRPTKRIRVTGKRTRSRDEIELGAIRAGAAPSA